MDVGCCWGFICQRRKWEQEEEIRIIIIIFVAVQKISYPFPTFFHVDKICVGE